MITKKITLTEAQKVPFNLDGKIMYTDSRLEIIHLTLYGNEEVEEHTNPFDVVFYILEGTATINAGGIEHTVEKDSTLNIPKGIIRAIKNNTSDRLRFLVMKVF